MSQLIGKNNKNKQQNLLKNPINKQKKKIKEKKTKEHDLKI